MENQASRKAINRISPELEKALEDSQFEIVQLKDGKGLCPGCSREVEMRDPGVSVKFTSVNVLCPNCKTEFRVVSDTGLTDGDDHVKAMEDALNASLQDDGEEEEEEAGMTTIPENEVIQYLLEYPNPSDDMFHGHCKDKGWDKHAAEAVAYRLATRYAQFRMGGRSKGQRPEQIVAKEESMGQQVEYEHTPIPDDALKIAWDHLAEAPESRYYTFLELIEKAIKAGPKHPVYQQLEKLAGEAESLPSES